MITPDDVGNAVFTRVAATSGYANTLPGALWGFGRVPDSPAGSVYAAYSVKSGAPEYTSGNPYIQNFTVSLMGYCPMGNATIVPQDVERFFNAALVWQQANMTLRGNASNETVLSVKPLDGNASFDPTLRQAKDVFTAGQVFEVKCQGNRAIN